MTLRLGLSFAFPVRKMGVRLNGCDWLTSAHDNGSQGRSSGSQDFGAGSIKHNAVPETLFRDEAFGDARYLVPPGEGI